MMIHLLKINQAVWHLFYILVLQRVADLVWLFSLECREKMDEILEQIPVELNKASISSILTMFLSFVE